MERRRIHTTNKRRTKERIQMNKLDLSELLDYFRNCEPSPAPEPLPSLEGMTESPTGIVISVEAGYQAFQRGVRVGMRIDKVNGADFTPEAMSSARACAFKDKTSYRITLVYPQAGVLFPNQCLHRGFLTAFQETYRSWGLLVKLEGKKLLVKIDTWWY